MMKHYGREPIDQQKAILPRGQVFLIPERCKGCGICIEFCPKQILIKSTRTNNKGYWLPEVSIDHEYSCIHCQFCSLVCPEFAIFAEEVVA